jgi:hypothetical protein
MAVEQLPPSRHTDVGVHVGPPERAELIVGETELMRPTRAEWIVFATAVLLVAVLLALLLSARPI